MFAQLQLELERGYSITSARSLGQTRLLESNPIDSNRIELILFPLGAQEYQSELGEG